MIVFMPLKSQGFKTTTHKKEYEESSYGKEWEGWVFSVLSLLKLERPFLDESDELF